MHLDDRIILFLLFLPTKSSFAFLFNANRATSYLLLASWITFLFLYPNNPGRLKMRMKSSKTNNDPPVNDLVPRVVPSNENIRRVYEYVQHSLNFIETKNGVFVALLGGLITSILSFSGDGGNDLWLYLSIIPPVTALIFLLLSFYPVKQRRYREGMNQEECKNIHLFRCENIAELSKDEFMDLLSGDLNRHQVEYICSASKTIARKYKLDFLRN
jgi:hypothetical protein